jgi:hypothetical protein
MGLRELAAGHLRRSILRLDHFAERGEYTPAGADASFPVTLAVGDTNDQVIDVVGGNAQNATISVVGSLSELRGGILGALHSERDPLPGDHWTVTSGAVRGVWVVLTVSPDSGDGCTLTLQYARRLGIHGGGDA